MIKCGMCGRCCADINSTSSPEQISNMVTPAGLVPLAECWIPAGRLADGRYHYRCNYYDARSKRCRIHEVRPRVCRDFPFYGKIEIGKAYQFDKDCVIYKYYAGIQKIKGGLK